MSFSYPEPRPAISIECVVLSIVDQRLMCCLQRRTEPPFAEQLSLPGQALKLEQDLPTAAKTVCREVTQSELVWLEQLPILGDIGRDPRGRALSIGFLACLREEANHVPTTTNGHEWMELPLKEPLAFDHDKHLAHATTRLQHGVRTDRLAFELLPKQFPFRTLQSTFEVLLGRTLDKRNFRKKILATKIVKELAVREQGTSHRAAQLFEFQRSEFDRQQASGELIDFA